jgi:hypothetical protein
LRRIRREFVLERGHARGFGLLRLVADVDFGSGIVADQHHRKTRRQAMIAFTRATSSATRRADRRQ